MVVDFVCPQSFSPPSPPRLHLRPTPQPLSSSHLHRDTHDERSPDHYAYAVPMPPQNARLDADYGSHAGWPPSGPRVYPDPSSIPPHWHVHPSTINQYRDARAYAPPAPPMQSNARAPWQNPYTRVLQVQPFVAPPPPPIPHKVWILDCKACGMFLTNRGMKVSALALHDIVRSISHPSPHVAMVHTHTTGAVALMQLRRAVRLFLPDEIMNDRHP